MSQLKALIIKEFREAVRDKRALMMAMSMAVMTPIIIYAMSTLMIKNMVSTPPVYVNVIGEEHAPQLIKQLSDENILLMTDAPEKDLSIWQARNITLNIPETFKADMKAGTTIDVVLEADYSDKAILSPLRRIRTEINNYSQTIGAKRLIMRGFDVRLLRPVRLLEQDTALPSGNATLILGMLGMYLLMVAFMSGLPTAIDSSAGERERNVLEMLLCQPVSTLKIVLAKLTCASTIAIVAMFLTLILTQQSISFVDLTKIGANINIDFYIFVVALIVMVPICFFATAIQLLVSFHAKSFKEAQSTVTMIIMAPAMIPMVLFFVDDKPAWLEWLPIAGQSLLIEDLLKGLPVNWLAILATGGTTIILTAVMVMFLSMKLKSEKVVLALS